VYYPGRLNKMKKLLRNPTRLAVKLLNTCMVYDEEFHIADTLQEIYEHLYETEGKRKADIWYWRQVLGSILKNIPVKIIWGFVLLKSYMKSAFRNIKRHRGFSSINITGLSIGMTCGILILLYVYYELSFDRYHKNADRIYRVLIRQPEDSYQGIDMFNTSPPPLKIALLNDFPEIKNAARIIKTDILINHKSNKYLEKRFFIVDPEFLRIFTFPLIAGDRETALDEPFSILMTEEMAAKYFGNRDPIGKVLNIDDKYEYKITGIIRNVPSNSHFKFDFLGSFNTLYTIYKKRGEHFFEDWNKYLFKTYIQLHSNINTSEFLSKFPVKIEKYRGISTKDEIHIQPLTGIHLGGNLNREIETNSDKRYVYLISAIALIIILIACFNYMNLTTARSATRMREIGIRKVVGACRLSLIRQFLSESVLITFIAMVISMMLVKLLLPLFCSFIEKELNYSILYDENIILILIGMPIIIGVISGSYPAFYLSSFYPLAVIKGMPGSRCGVKRSSIFRGTLVTVQFIISMALIIFTMTVNKQLIYIRNRELGFEKEFIVTLPIQGEGLKKNYEPFKNELIQYANIVDISSANHLPFAIESSGGADWDGKPENNSTEFRLACVDHNFLDFYGIRLVRGRYFDKEITTDIEQAYILNETAVSIIGWEEPIGKRFNFQRNIDGRVIGVVRDFHCNSLHRRIEPLVIGLIKSDSRWWSAGYISIKISFEDISGTLAFIEKKFKKFSPAYPFNYSFLDERIDRMYREEQKLRKNFGYFTFIAIFIACLGLFGLAFFTAEQYTKEIGIRKVLGASVFGIFIRLSRGYIKWVILANLIAWPLTYYFVDKWLQRFAYRVNLSIWIFILSGLTILVIALLTVSYQSIKAATANPVNSLRYE
jgi:putative ABC transport system permease protein